MDRERLIYIVTWDNHSRDTYRYGTELSFREDGCVLFRNALMPSGTVLRSWSSHKYYPADRIEPQLPILRDGQLYVIRAFWRSRPEDTVLLRLRFYNRQQRLLRTSVLELSGENGQAGFEAPSGTDDWRLELVAGGMTELLFHHLEIRAEEETMISGGRPVRGRHGTDEEDSAEAEDSSKTGNAAEPGSGTEAGNRQGPEEWNILILRTQSRTVHVPPEEIRHRIPGLRLVSAPEADWRLSSGRLLTEELAELAGRAAEDGTQKGHGGTYPVRINFIGYDDRTDELAVRARVAMYGTGLSALCHVLEADRCVAQPAEVNRTAAVFADRRWILEKLPELLESAL